MATKRGVSIVGVILDVVIAAIIILVFSAFLTGIFSNIPTAKGAIVDATQVICFGGGADHSVHCLDKATGNDKFTFTAATAWKVSATSTPALTKNAIYFAVGQYFCSYDITGKSKFDCSKFAHTIATGIAADEAQKLACFGGGADHTVWCKSTDGGDYFKVHTTSWGDAISTPAIRENSVYFCLGNHCCKLPISTGPKENAEGTTWCDEGTQPILTGIVVDESQKLVCLGGGTDQTFWCENSDDGVIYWKKQVNNANALATPTIVSGSVYFAVGNNVFKYSIDGEEIWRSLALNTVDTGFAVGDGLVCFSDGQSVRCLDDVTGAAKFSFRASCDVWDFCKTDSTPLISNKILYFALGDKACSANTSTKGIVDFTQAGNYTGANWCVDFDEQIKTDIVEENTQDVTA